MDTGRKRSAVGYVRVSSESQLDGYGPENQEADLRAWCKANGARLLAIHRDDARSGTLDPGERPGLSAALDDLRSGRATGIVFGRLDRLARGLAVQEGVLASVWNLGARAYAAAEGGEVHEDDPDDPMRTAMRQMRGVFSQLDRAQIVKRLRDGRRAKAAAGRKAVGAYAFGYRGDGKGRDRDAVVDPDEWRAVELIVARLAEGASYRAIAAELDEAGLRPRRAEAWSAMAVRNVANREMPAA
jgi:DNA invertase Pin-like site-specific DNA recombinase